MKNGVRCLAAVIALTVFATRALAQGQRSDSKGLAATRAECRVEANRKGLVGQAKRTERQSFMQKCVHGST
jgi:hypothetical protein